MDPHASIGGYLEAIRINHCKVQTKYNKIQMGLVVICESKGSDQKENRSINPSKIGK